MYKMNPYEGKDKKEKLTEGARKFYEKRRQEITATIERLKGLNKPVSAEERQLREIEAKLGINA